MWFPSWSNTRDRLWTKSSGVLRFFLSRTNTAPEYIPRLHEAFKLNWLSLCKSGSKFSSEGIAKVGHSLIYLFKFLAFLWGKSPGDKTRMQAIFCTCCHLYVKNNTCIAARLRTQGAVVVTRWKEMELTQEGFDPLPPSFHGLVLIGRERQRQLTASGEKQEPIYTATSMWKSDFGWGKCDHHHHHTLRISDICFITL